MSEPEIKETIVSLLTKFMETIKKQEETATLMLDEYEIVFLNTILNDEDLGASRIQEPYRTAVMNKVEQFYKDDCFLPNPQGLYALRLEKIENQLVFSILGHWYKVMKNALA